jgi:predicted permease
MHIVLSIRQSFRQFRREPLYAFSVAGTLALAVAAATASFAVVKRAFLDPLPYRDAHELVSVLTLMNGDTWALSAPVFEDLRGSNPSISSYAPIDPEGVTFSDGKSVAEPTAGAYITPEYFTTLGVRPALGEVWRTGDQYVAILSWAFWQAKSGGDPQLIGRTVMINGVEHAVAGVMPEGFVPPYFTNTSVWLPLDMQPLMAGSGRARRTLSVIARLSPGATIEELNAQLDVLTTRLKKDYPQIHGNQSWIAHPLREQLVWPASPVVIGTSAAAVLLLVLVFANVAGLSAARAVGMRRQLAVRAALGASRARLWRERVFDSLGIAIVGAGIGLWLGDTIITIVASYQPEFMPRLAPVALDPTTMAVGSAIAILAGLSSALVPQGAAAVASLDALRSSRTSTGSATVAKMRAALVVTQVALALVLLVGAGLLVRTVHHLMTTTLGFNPAGMTTFTVTMPVPKYAAAERHLQFERDVLERLDRIPGVTGSAASVGLPVIVATRASLSIQGRSDQSGRGEIAYMSMSPGFAKFAQMPIVQGRDLAPTDTAKSELVVLINETMARQYWPAGDSIGAKVRIGPGTGGPMITIVGIVADVRQHGPTHPVMPTAFGSTLQYSWPRRNFTVRSERSAAALAGELRAAIHAAEPDVAMGAVQTIDDLVSNQTGRHRLVMFALAFFAAVATALCALGLFSVVTLTSQMRRREYAIRMALGAERRSVRSMVFREALVLAVAGAAGGVLIAAVGTRLLGALLHGVTPLDALTFGAALVLVLVLALVSASLPARAAGRVDPVEALRAE